jgi:lipoprotein-releasing system ATP-binding protein
MSDSGIVLTASAVKKSFQMGQRKVDVLHGVDVDIRKGEMLGILGPSGAGKSTLLHIMGLLEAATAGTITYDGTEISSLSDRERSRYRNRHFGFVFQMYHLLPDLTALENVLMPVMISNSVMQWMGRRGQYRARATELLGGMGLGDRLTHRPAQLSGGERQRVAIARSLIHEPGIVFCDEPTGNLDTKTSAEIVELLKSVNREQNVTFVIVTHSEALAEGLDRVVRIVDGRVVNGVEASAPAQ